MWALRCGKKFIFRHGLCTQHSVALYNFIVTVNYSVWCLGCSLYIFSNPHTPIFTPVPVLSQPPSSQTPVSVSLQDKTFEGWLPESSITKEIKKEDTGFWQSTRNYWCNFRSRKHSVAFCYLYLYYVPCLVPWFTSLACMLAWSPTYSTLPEE